MKIVVLGPSFPYRGGISHYTSLLARELEKNNTVKVITFKRLYPNFLWRGKNQMDESQVKIAVPAERILDSINPVSWVKAFQTIWAFQPKMVILQWWHPFFAPCYLVLGALIRLFLDSKICFICHNIYGHESFPLEAVLTKATFLTSHAFIVHSHTDRVKLKRIVPGAEIFTSPHPTYEVFRFGDISSEEAKTLLGWPGKSLLFFGLIRDYKGLDYLIKAMKMVLKKIECRLYIAGDVYHRKETYQAMIRQLELDDHVILIDRYIPNEEVQLFFSAADLVVLPYLTASQSGVIQIAYAFNKPVIATKTGGFQEVVDDGKTGYLVEPGDERALAEAILRFFLHDSPETFAHHIESIRERFSWEKMTTLIESIG